MSGTLKRFAAMKRNPRNNWSLTDVSSVCKFFGLDCHSAADGSHYVVSHPAVDGMLTIASRQPVKPLYIMLLTQMADAVAEEK